MMRYIIFHHIYPIYMELVFSGLAFSISLYINFYLPTDALKPVNLSMNFCKITGTIIMLHIQF